MITYKQQPPVTTEKPNGIPDYINIGDHTHASIKLGRHRSNHYVEILGYVPGSEGKVVVRGQTKSGRTFYATASF